MEDEQALSLKRKYLNFMDPIIFITIIFLFLCFMALSWFAGSDAPYVPTKIDNLKALLKKAGVDQGKTFYELGSGDGRVVLEAAKLGAEAHGIEQSWIRTWHSRYQARKLKIKNASFFHGDIFERNYYPADVVYIYLLQKAVDKLEKKLKAELEKGSVIITQTYHFKNWQPFLKEGNFWLYKS